MGSQRRYQSQCRPMHQFDRWNVGCLIYSLFVFTKVMIMVQKNKRHFLRLECCVATSVTRIVHKSKQEFVCILKKRIKFDCILMINKIRHRLQLVFNITSYIKCFLCVLAHYIMSIVL